MTHPPIRSAFICLALLTSGFTSALAGDASDAAVEGKLLLNAHCARCHSIESTGDSPLPKAPPLRAVYVKYPIDQLESGLAEGMGSKHPEMPQIQFSNEEVSAILDYLGTVTGLPPSKRMRIHVPGESIPP
jgi:mono/diheme cytochrome c family protein